MSKGSVGDVYAKVIDEVCAASRVDFEEGGVELTSLDLLKSVWQKKVSQLKVAQMPWEPKPAPPESVTSSNPKPSATLPSNGHTNSPPSSHSTPGPQIKQDVSSYPLQQQQQPPPQQQQQQPAGVAGQYSVPQFPSNRPLTAQERAAMNLHQVYGPRAGTQIAQLQQQNGQSRIPMQQPVRQPQPGTFIKREDGASDNPQIQDYKPDLSQSIPIKSSQTDGATDVFKSELATRRALVAQHRDAGDRLMKAHFRASQQELEGGGLLLPLDERSTPIRVASNRAEAATTGTSTLRRTQGDAAGDDEDVDEDAINSDLDDPDELDDANQEEEAVQEVMLCTYDKVQRVKNKWKCTLKDGILRVGGNDYVFHKGQGEFEW